MMSVPSLLPRYYEAVRVRPGMHVTPNVRLCELLGEGGMGCVWIADHLGLETQVAVKFILSDRNRRQEKGSRFKLEASTAAQLNSPHVVKLFDYGLTDDQTPFMVMELLKGESLADRLEREGSISAGSTSTIVAQVCRVLAEAHGIGVVHRDIKPDNLFLVDAHDDELFVKVLDFGVAKHIAVGGEDDATMTQLTASGAMVGTPVFMSPEQLLADKELDHRADLWALSAVAYCCLTGQLPFTGDTVGALTLSVHEGKAAPPSSLADHLGPAVDAWFERAFHRQRDERFGSAKELAGSFAQVVAAGRGETAHKVVISGSEPPVAATADTIAEPVTDRDSSTREAETAAKPSTLEGATAAVDETARPQAWMRPAWLVLGALMLAAAVFSWTTSDDSTFDAAAQPGGSTSASDPDPSQTTKLKQAAFPAATAASGQGGETQQVPMSSVSASAVPTRSAPPSAKPVRPQGPPPPTKAPPPTATPTKGGKPAYCVDHGFTVDQDGYKHPKPECL